MNISTTEPTDLATRLGRVIVLVVLTIAIAMFVVAPVLAWSWFSQPFLGMLLEPTLVLSPLEGEGWARLQPDPPLAQPDRLAAIDGQSVRMYDDIATILRGHAVGDTVRVRVVRPDGSQREEFITLASFALTDLFLQFVVPYAVGLTYLAVGIWVYRVRGGRRAGQAFSVLSAGMALVVGCMFDLNTTHRLALLWVAVVPLTAAAAMHLVMVFPREPRLVRRVPVLRLLPYFPGLILAFLAALSVYNVGQPWAYIERWRGSYLFVAIGIAFMLGMFVYRLALPASPLIRQQSRIVLLGTVLAFLPIMPWLLLNVLGNSVPFIMPLYAPLFIFFPFSIAYAILRYRLLDVDRLLSHGLAYGVLISLVVVIYFTLVNGLSLFFAVQTDDPILISLFVLGLILLLNPLRDRLQELIDRIFLRESVDYRGTLQSFSRELTQTLDLDAVLAKVGRQIEGAMHPANQWAFLYDEDRACYVGRPVGLVQQATVPVTFATDGALASWLRDRQGCLYLPPEREAPAELAEEQVRMEMLGVEVYVPLRTRERLSGWLALGPKNSGQPYHSDDLDLLCALADQSALGVENARLFTEQRRLEAQERFIRETFQRYVSPAVVQRLLEDPSRLKLGGQQQQVTVLFADIRGFTPFAQHRAPEELVEVLNRYLAIGADAVLAEEGLLDKFMGDAVMGVFNAPLSQPDHTLRAVRAALRMQETIQEHHRAVSHADHLSYGIGIALGDAVVGNIGAARQLNYTAVGASVNLAKRLQEHAGAGQILFCERTYDRVKEQVMARPLAPMTVEGVGDSVQVYELLGLR